MSDYKIHYCLPEGTFYPVPNWRFEEKELELLAIYQFIINFANAAGLYNLVNYLTKDVIEDIKEGYFSRLQLSSLAM